RDPRRYQTALHETGHALVCAALSVRFDHVTTEADEKTKGRIELCSTATASERIAIYLAGCKAETRSPRRTGIDNGAGDDRLIDAVLAEIGETRSDATFRDARRQAGEILQAKQAELYAGAIALFRVRRLDESAML